MTANPQQAIRYPIAAAAAVLGALAAWHYHRLGLTLTHYDARGHLVVARRIADSITPGWQQIGAVWLPLPHLLNAIPVQVDRFYRSGVSAVAISVAAFAVATSSIASTVLALTGSTAAAIAAAAVFALNPNVLYLQSTPMTESLLVALITLAVAMLLEWSQADLKVCSTSAGRGARIGWMFALACMTRYEAWPITAGALAAASWSLGRHGAPWASAWRAVCGIGMYPCLAILGFILFSRVVIGEWVVSSDFFVPENKARQDLSMAAAEIGWGVRALSGPALTWMGGIGIVALIGAGLGSRRRAGALVAVSLIAAATIPWLAFYKGHPFRIRYMMPLVAVEAVGAGSLAGFSRRGRLIASCLVFGVAAFELRPLDRSAPMIVEAQWDRPNVPARRAVTACLDAPGSGVKIMASMGSLGHYMQETSTEGYAVRDFLHEGNGDIWLAALNNPRPYARWVLIEEKAEGGDMLARLVRARPAFLAGYTRVCEGAGLALYRRSE